MAAIKSRREAKPPVGVAPPKPKTSTFVLPHTKLPPSFKKPLALKSPPTNEGDYGPQPSRGGISPSVGGPEEGLSEAQQQLHKLLAKQLDTSTSSSVESALSHVREFTPAVVYRPLADERKGVASLTQFVSREEEMEWVESLRGLGLTQHEIELKLIQANPAAKKRRLGAEPSAQRERINAVNQKISERLKMIEEPTTYHGVKPMSRHAMEVERSLFRGSDGGNSLDHLTREERGGTHKTAYPKSIMPVSSEQESPAHSVDHTHVAEGPVQLPIQVIERNRLTEAEIRALPRFRNYQPGPPTKVLYLKNLHSKVSADDLRALFGGGPQIRLLTGRMRGQAFLEFDCKNSCGLY
ncbi:RNA-binding protein 41-like isoform X2 [Halichondria panicea]|uniref:RNA-binding protein 41-like isoform X2 n=1 Tax=Halichondria panicea TaxID=6063 RepID=UPI00312B5633